jgi:hypothetical protein
MGIWTEAVERKAAIIHSQLAAARQLALLNGGLVDEVSQPYLELLRTLYADEFPFAQLTDTSDLVARFSGPAVDAQDPTVSIVISVFSDIREQIRAIARSVVGLATDRQVRWPSNLDPHLSGIAHGSLIVGVSVAPPALESARAQLELDGVSDQVFASVRSAVRSLSVVARHVGDTSLDSSFKDEFPDPAIRDTVLVAAKRLAPTGRRGIDSVSFFSSQSEEASPAALTPRSRIVIASALQTPVQLPGSGDFVGVLREIDLDARRFEIRGVNGIGSIRCAYTERHDETVRKALDARVRVSGGYETLVNGKPRLVAVESLDLVALPPTQLTLRDDET